MCGNVIWSQHVSSRKSSYSKPKRAKVIPMSKFSNLMSMKDFVEKFNESLTGSIGINKLYALVREDGFPSVKIGSRYYILADEVNDWLERQSNGKRGEADDR